MKKLEGEELEEFKARLKEAERRGCHERDSTYDPYWGMHTWFDDEQSPPECPECGDTMRTCFDDDDLWWCDDCFITHPKGEKS